MSLDALRARYFVGPTKPTPEEVVMQLRPDMRRWCDASEGCCCIGCAGSAFRLHGYGKEDFVKAAESLGVDQRNAP